MKKFLLMIAAIAALTSCTSKKQNAETTEPTEATTAKTLVLYYSQTNTTKQVAEIFQQKLGADIESIELENPYTGDFNATIARCQEEMAAGTAPEIKPLAHDLDAYDTIYLGFPVWFGTYAMPISGLLKSVDLSGKTIVPFCTFGSGGLVEATNALTEALPESYIMNGYGVRAARVSAAAEEINRFLITNQYKEGDLKAYDFFPEHHECSEEELAIFREATSSYDFPLGLAETVSSRAIDGGTEYQYTTFEQTTIYVIVKDGKAEFTRVDR